MALVPLQNNSAGLQCVLIHMLVYLFKVVIIIEHCCANMLRHFCVFICAQCTDAVLSCTLHVV